MQRQHEIEVARFNRMLARNYSAITITKATQISIQALRDRIETLFTVEHYYQRLLSVRVKFPPNTTISGGGDKHFFVNAFVGVRKLGDLYPTLRELAALGWRRSAATTLPKDNNTDIYYRFNHKDDPDLRLTLCSSLILGKEGGDTCYRVQVGEETKTMPIYEVVCPDAALEEGAVA